MKTRPILFSGPMVRAVLEGRKTQTRRVVDLKKLCGPNETHEARGRWVESDGLWRSSAGKYNVWSNPVQCPYGKPGDRLWVRESWSHTGEAVWSISDARARGKAGVIYRATDEEPVPGCWWPSIHMPREFSRITLEITGVRVERLHEISEGDAIAEGVESKPSERWEGRKVWRDFTPDDPASPDGEWFERARDSYRSLWRSINGPDSWKLNPWVWVVEFTRLINP